MKRSIRSLAFVLAFLLISAVFPLVPFNGGLKADAASASGKCGSNVKWSLSSGALTISGSGKMYDYSEDEETPWIKYYEEIETLTIKSGITYIGNYAFAGLVGVTSVNVPGSVESIGDYAFALCASLESATLEKGVKTIGKFAFMYCVQLKTISMPDTVNTISDYAFSYCISLLSVTIPKGIKKLGDGAFYLSFSLEQIYFPDGIEDLGTGSFLMCRSLQQITIPKSVKTMENCLIGYTYMIVHNDDGLLVPYGDIMHDPYFSIKCYSGSAAEKYAMENNFECVLFDPQYYTITYDTNGGKEASFNETKTQHQKAVITYTVPTKTPLTIRYDANGGTGAPESKTVTPVFDSWNTKPNGSGDKYESGSYYTEDASITLYAQWNVGWSMNVSDVKPSKELTITFDTGVDGIEVQEKKIAASFKNWNTARNGTGDTYTRGMRVMTDKDVTLYAQWTYTPAGELFAPERDGFAFVGWYTAPVGGGRVTEETTVSGNITLYAHWSDRSLFKDGSVYQLDDGSIYSVDLGTSTDDFRSQFVNDITVKDENGNEAASAAVVSTGYTAEYGEDRYTVVIKGDTNGDGKIDGTDYILVKRHILKVSMLNGAYGKAADADGNGKIDSTDYITVKRHILGISKLA